MPVGHPKHKDEATAMIIIAFAVFGVAAPMKHIGAKEFIRPKRAIPAFMEPKRVKPANELYRPGSGVHS